MNTRRLTMTIVGALLFGLATGSVLLLGYAAAAASILMIAGLLVKRAIGRRTGEHLELAPIRASRIEDREAA